MDFHPDAQKQVYLYAKEAFGGERAMVRKTKPVRRIIDYYHRDLAQLREDFGQDALVGIIRALLKEGVFSSVLTAKAKFPELFPTSQKSHPEATELQVSQYAKDVSKEIYSGKEDATAPEGIMVHHGTSSPTQSLQKTPLIPSLYPPCIPYKTQHCLLTTAQGLLEECCFDFAMKWLPNVVNDNGWDCGAAVELTQWAGILSIEYADKIPSYALDLVRSPLSLNALFTNTHEIRHAAVHRVPTTARGISRLLDCGAQLAEALRDSLRASQLERLKVALDDKIKSMELTKSFLENETTTKLESIRRQKEELDRQGRELIAHMVKQDQENNALMGRVLMESIESVLSPNTHVEEDEVLHTETDLFGAHEYQFEEEDFLRCARRIHFLWS